MYRTANFWSKFWEIPGELNQTSKKLLNLRCIWRCPHKGNFWEARGRLLQKPPKAPWTSQKVLQKTAPQWILFFSVWALPPPLETNPTVVSLGFASLRGIASRAGNRKASLREAWMSTQSCVPLSSLGKSKWGLSNGGLTPHSAMCAQSSTIVHFVGLLGPFLRGTFVAKWRQS